MKIINLKIKLCSLVLLVSSCKMADIQTDYMSASQNVDDDKKGRQLLEESVKAMGYDNLQNVSTYQVNALFDWKFPWKTMPLNSLPGAKGNSIQFRFRTNSFDGQVEYLEGRNKGEAYGLQSWQTYKIKNDEIELTNDKRRSWGLSSYHYMLEGPYRLLNADIIRYAGTSTFEGKDYDLVFVSWHKAEPQKEYDQWLLYINKNTKFVDMSNLTIRDFFMPFPPNMAEGTVRYLNRKKTSSGIYFPESLVIQLLDPKKEKKHVYRITLDNYQFDTFDVNDLSPIKGLPVYDDEKPMENK